MRRKLVLGMGLVGLFGGSASGQFAVDRPPTPSAVPAAPAPILPAAPAYVAPVGGFQPAATAPVTNTLRPAAAPVQPVPIELPLALGTNHPLLVKPENGAYFICLKSYSRPARPDPADPGLSARELAEALAAEVQKTHGVRVYLYEYVSEEKKAEAAARAVARQRAAAFATSMEELKRASQLNGMTFLDPDHTVKYQTFRYRDQIAVLVGGFKSEDDAVKGMPTVKAWPSPKDNRLMDGGAVVRPGPDGKPVIEKMFMNPFQQAMVVQNPSIHKEVAPVTGIDPFLVKLNEGRPYNLLKASRTWTIGVKSFNAPVQISSGEDTSMKRQMGSGKGADILAAGAEQAEALAKALRSMTDKSTGKTFESFVLHTRTGSIVTVGQFDAPNDPALLEMRRKLAAITFNLSKDSMGQQITGTQQRLFGDNILPVPIPKP